MNSLHWLRHYTTAATYRIYRGHRCGLRVDYKAFMMREFNIHHKSLTADYRALLVGQQDIPSTNIAVKNAFFVEELMA